jgi:hypothetical protein
VRHHRDAAHHHHHDLEGEDHDERDRRHDDHRDGHLGEHRDGVRNRQRLPEQDAAVAPLAVQRVEAVEEGDEVRGEQQRDRGDVVAHRDVARLAQRVRHTL